MSIIGTIASFITPSIISQIAGLLGASPGSVETAMKGAGPGVLSAILSATSNRQGADAFSAALSRQQPGMLDNLGSMLQQNGRGVADSGADMLSSILGGGRMGVFASKLKDYAGLPEGSAGSLLGLAGSLAMAAIGKNARDQGLDAAGALRALESEKDEIARAMPSDFAKSLAGAGLLDSIADRIAVTPAAAAAPKPAAPRPAATTTRTTVAPPPPQRSGGWWRWVVGLGVLALLAWLLSNLLGGEPEVVEEPAPVVTEEPEAVVEEEETVVEEPEAVEPPAATTTTEAPEPAEPPAATTTTEAPEPADANPLVVDGTDIGATVQGALGRLTDTLGGVTDAASAEAALPTLTAVRDELSGLEATVGALPAAGKSALQTLVNGALPAIRETSERLLGDSAIAGVIKPVLDDVLARLTAYAAG